MVWRHRTQPLLSHSAGICKIHSYRLSQCNPVACSDGRMTCIGLWWQRLFRWLYNVTHQEQNTTGDEFHCGERLVICRSLSWSRNWRICRIRKFVVSCSPSGLPLDPVLSHTNFFSCAQSYTSTDSILSLCSHTYLQTIFSLVLSHTNLQIVIFSSAESYKSTGSIFFLCSSHTNLQTVFFHHRTPPRRADDITAIHVPMMLPAPQCSVRLQKVQPVSLVTQR
jgi:hypothetical protein